MPVISGGLLLSPSIPGSGQVPGGYGAAQFLAAMYGAGASATMDALAVHIYPSDYVAGVPTRWDPVAMQAWLKLLDPVRAAAGASGQPMWITEMGVSTSTQAGWPAASTPSEQASDLGAMLAIARATPNVPYVIVHSLEDQTPGLRRPIQRDQHRLGRLHGRRRRQAGGVRHQHRLSRLAELPVARSHNAAEPGRYSGILSYSARACGS